MMNISPRDRRHRRLLDRARGGDSEAFCALFHELYDLVFGFAARRLGRREDAEDLVAKVLERFLVDRFDPTRGTVRNWVLAMAHNALIDFRRTAHPSADLTVVSEVIGDGAKSPLDEIVRREEFDGLARRVAALDPSSRELIILHFGDGLSHREIATLVDATPAAIRQRLSRAQRELKQKLSGGKHV